MILLLSFIFLTVSEYPYVGIFWKIRPDIPHLLAFFLRYKYSIVPPKLQEVIVTSIQTTQKIYVYIDVIKTIFIFAASGGERGKYFLIFIAISHLL